MMVCLCCRAQSRIRPSSGSVLPPQSRANSVSLATRMVASGATSAVVVEERRGVEDRAEAARLGDLEGAPRRGLRHLLLQDEHRARGQGTERRVRIGGRHRAVRAGQDGDDVLAVRIDEDHRDAGGAVAPRERGEIDTVRLEQRRWLRRRTHRCRPRRHGGPRRPRGARRAPGWRPCRPRPTRTCRRAPSRPASGCGSRCR